MIYIKLIWKQDHFIQKFISKVRKICFVASMKFLQFIFKQKKQKKKNKQKIAKKKQQKEIEKKPHFGITCINKVYTCSWDISLDYICDWCSTNRTLLQGNATAATAANVATRFKQHPSILIETYLAQSLFLEVLILSQYFV